MLLEDDLPKFPFSVLTSVLFWVKLARFEILERLVSDSLSEVDVFELPIKLLDPDVDEIIDLHAWSHEARFEFFHSLDIIALLRQRHPLETLELVCLLSRQAAINTGDTDFHRYFGLVHFHLLNRMTHEVCLFEVVSIVLRLADGPTHIESCSLIFGLIEAPHLHSELNWCPELLHRLI